MGTGYAVLGTGYTVMGTCSWYKVRCYGYRVRRCRGMLVVQGSLLWVRGTVWKVWGAVLQGHANGTRYAVPCPVYVWSTAFSVESWNFVLRCQLDRHQHADFPVWRLLSRHAHLQTQFQSSQSHMQFAIAILQSLQVLERSSLSNDCADSIRSSVPHDWTIHVPIRLSNRKLWLNSEFRPVWTHGPGSF